MYFPSLISHAAELFRIIVKSPHPPDGTASEYLRSKKYIGSKERKFISAATFAALRMKLLAEKAAEFASNSVVQCQPAELGTLLATCLTGEKSGAWKPDDVLFPAAYRDSVILPISNLCKITLIERCDFTEETASVWIESLLQFCHDRQSLADAGNARKVSVELSESVAMPEWILRHWSDTTGVSDAVLRARAMLSAAQVCLRVNSMMISREKVQKELENLGISSRPGVLSPDALLLYERVNILQTQLYTSGAIEVQDEGSQIIGFAASPNPSDEILDACAGAGGKSLHLAIMQQDKGRIVASDADPRRLRAISSRAERCGIRSISVNSSFAHANNFRSQFDIVVVDAPCSGMGTVRRTPTIKWRLTESSLRKISRKQAEIIQHYSRFVRPGGILLYATCSLMIEENESVVQKFLDSNPDFSPDDLHEVFSKRGLSVAGVMNGDYSCTLTPELHGTDGFFMARFVRR